MFAPHHQVRADELVRVCRPGGTIGLLSWTPEGFIGQMFATMKPYVAAAARPARSRRRCGAARSTCGSCSATGSRTSWRAGSRCGSTGSRPLRSSGTSSRRTYGPTIAAYRGSPTDPDQVAALDAALAALGRRYDRGGGAMEWEYLLLTCRAR